MVGLFGALSEHRESELQQLWLRQGRRRPIQPAATSCIYISTAKVSQVRIHKTLHDLFVFFCFPNCSRIPPAPVSQFVYFVSPWIDSRMSVAAYLSVCKRAGSPVTSAGDLCVLWPVGFQHVCVPVLFHSKITMPWRPSTEMVYSPVCA